jgi:hypothetical protein
MTENDPQITQITRINGRKKAQETQKKKKGVSRKGARGAKIKRE